MSRTPITDAISTDPAIEKRDVPVRVWRIMTKMECDRADLVEALRNLIEAGETRELGTFTDALDAARTLLDRVEAK